MKLPTLFISHGSPMLAIEDSPARRFLLELGESLPRPQAVLVASAHWETRDGLAVSVVPQPETIHDFGGFPDALFQIRYPAPGAPDVAGRATQTLEQAGFAVTRNAARGLDHGAWVPLRLIYPEADIPTAQVSLRHGGSPKEHLRLGEALAGLREEGVLVVGSGAMTHNLAAWRGAPLDAPVPSWVSDFADWMRARIEGNRHDELLAYRARAPHAARNHPTEEHLLPLFVALGAAGGAATAERLHGSYQYGVLAMDTYAFS